MLKLNIKIVKEVADIINSQIPKHINLFKAKCDCLLIIYLIIYIS
jgi:DNA polymerase elongation subunit (family B)